MMGGGSVGLCEVMGSVFWGLVVWVSNRERETHGERKLVSFMLPFPAAIYSRNLITNFSSCLDALTLFLYQ